MRGRFFAFGPILALTLVVGVPAAIAASPGAQPTDIPAERLLLRCTGAMSTDGRAIADRDDPAARIVADGVADFADMRITGFGIGTAPIVLLTDAMIGFGVLPVDTLTPVAERAPAKAATGTIVEGSIDRETGATRILVHPAADPGSILIAMSLDCAFEAAPG